MLSFHKQRETVTLSFGTRESRGFRLHCFCSLHRSELNKPQNNLQNSCISRLSEDLPECFRISETCSQTHVIWAQKGLVNDVWMEHVCVTALSGADWQGKPTPQRDGSLFPISQATALSQDREPSIFSTREKKRQTEKEGEPELWKAWEPIKRRKPSPLGSSIFRSNSSVFFKILLPHILFFLAHISVLNFNSL